MDNNFLKTSTIIGQKVQNPQGEHIGTIRDVIVLQKESVAFAVLSHGVFSANNGKYHVVPIEAFGFAIQERPIINEIIISLDINKNELKKVPGFDKNNWPDTIGTEFINSVYNYHGLDQPRRPNS